MSRILTYLLHMLSFICINIAHYLIILYVLDSVVKTATGFQEGHSVLLSLGITSSGAPKAPELLFGNEFVILWVYITQTVCTPQ